MAFHHIQCPNCFTDYTISDEKYRATEGRMRCGTCREQFTAMVVTQNAPPPQFDPREVFIEPLSAPLPASDGGDISASKEPEPSYVSYEKSVDPDEQNIELMSTHEFEYTGPKEPEVPKDIVDGYADSDELSTTEILNNLRNRQPQGATSKTGAEDDDQAAQLNLELPSINADSEGALNDAQNLNKDALIETVDQLVDEKLAKSKPAISSLSPARPLASPPEDDFFLEPKKTKRQRKSGLGGVVIKLFMLLLILALAATLAYQSWLKQWFDLPHHHPWFIQAQSFVQPYWNQAEKRLTELGVELPKRQNLSQLELVSALTEPHPSRSNTVLLKVSLINRANITQALPWLEMSLTDADGRLVARRNLSPEDYIYKNRTQASIGPNELKKVTIELLSFPKSATGYEIKLLSQ